MCSNLLCSCVWLRSLAHFKYMVCVVTVVALFGLLENIGWYRQISAKQPSRYLWISGGVVLPIFADICFWWTDRRKLAKYRLEYWWISAWQNGSQEWSQGSQGNQRRRDLCVLSYCELLLIRLCMPLHSSSIGCKWRHTFLHLHQENVVAPDIGRSWIGGQQQNLLLTAGLT